MADLSELKVGDRVVYNANTGHHHPYRDHHGREGTITEVIDPDTWDFPIIVHFGTNPLGDIIACHEDELTVVQAGESRG